jgi:hypothetical protein
MILSVNSINKLIFVTVTLCFLWDTDWIIKYLDKLRLQKLNIYKVYLTHLDMVNVIQCVHKVPSGFWKIVARKQYKEKLFLTVHCDMCSVIN